MTHDKKWYGNPEIQELLGGPFYGFGLEGMGRATEVDFAIRSKGQFTIRYQLKYVICSGPQIVEALQEILTEEERAATMYQADTLSECIEALYHGEGLRIDDGFRRPNDGDTENKSAPF